MFICSIQRIGADVCTSENYICVVCCGLNTQTPEQFFPATAIQNEVFRLHRMREMLTILTDVGGVCMSVSLSVTRLKSTAVHAVYAACHVCGNSPNAFDLLLAMLIKANTVDNL